MPMPTPKTEEEAQAARASFDAALDRILKSTGTRTQVELTALLGIKQSSISYAKKRGNIPSDWLLKLYRSHGLNPDWLLTGEGPRYLAPADEAWEREAKPEPAKPTVAELIDQIKTSLAPCVVSVRVEAGDIEAAPTGPIMVNEAA